MELQGRTLQMVKRESEGGEMKKKKKKGKETL